MGEEELLWKFVRRCGAGYTPVRIVFVRYPQNGLVTYPALDIFGGTPLISPGCMATRDHSFFRL